MVRIFLLLLVLLYIQIVLISSNYDYKYDTRNSKSSVAVACFLPGRAKNLSAPLYVYRDADKSLARPTSQRILFDGENISFDAGLVMYINSTNIPPITIINRIYENQSLLLL
jgi:hypothetical protein